VTSYLFIFLFLSTLARVKAPQDLILEKN